MFRNCGIVIVIKDVTECSSSVDGTVLWHLRNCHRGALMMRFSAVVGRGLCWPCKRCPPHAKQFSLLTKGMKFETAEEVDRFFSSGLVATCSRVDIIDLLAKSSRIAKKRASISLVKKHLPAVAARLESFPSAGWIDDEIAGVCVSIRYLKPSDEGIAKIIETMTRAAAKSIELNRPVKPQHITDYLLGLGGGKLDRKSVV